MSVILLKQVPLSAAEQVVAIVWRALEADRLVSPAIAVARHLNGQIDIRLAFSGRADAERVKRALLRLMPAIDAGNAPWLADIQSST